MLNRQKELLQWLVGGLATSAFIVGGVWLTDNRDRVIAEVMGGSYSSPSVADTTKLQVLEKHSEASLDSEHKASGNMQVTLSSAEGRRSDGSLAVEAHVTAMSELTDLKYEWVLPDGTTVSAGTPTGSLGTLAEGASAVSTLTVNVSSSNSQIVFHAYRELAGEKIGQVAQYNTVDQSTLDTKLALKRDSLVRTPASNARRFE